jgi:hypothetical protein
MVDPLRVTDCVIANGIFHDRIDRYLDSIATARAFLVLINFGEWRLCTCSYNVMRTGIRFSVQHNCIQIRGCSLGSRPALLDIATKIMHMLVVDGLQFCLRNILLQADCKKPRLALHF